MADDQDVDMVDAENLDLNIDWATSPTPVKQVVAEPVVATPVVATPVVATSDVATSDVASSLPVGLAVPCALSQPMCDALDFYETLAGNMVEGIRSYLYKPVMNRQSSQEWHKQFNVMYGEESKNHPSSPHIHQHLYVTSVSPEINTQRIKKVLERKNLQSDFCVTDFKDFEKRFLNMSFRKKIADILRDYFSNELSVTHCTMRLLLNVQIDGGFEYMTHQKDVDIYGTSYSTEKKTTDGVSLFMVKNDNSEWIATSMYPDEYHGQQKAFIGEFVKECKSGSSSIIKVSPQSPLGHHISNRISPCDSLETLMEKMRLSVSNGIAKIIKKHRDATGSHSLESSSITGVIALCNKYLEYGLMARHCEGDEDLQTYDDWIEVCKTLGNFLDMLIKDPQVQKAPPIAEKMLKSLSSDSPLKRRSSGGSSSPPAVTIAAERKAACESVLSDISRFLIANTQYNPNLSVSNEDFYFLHGKLKDLLQYSLYGIDEIRQAKDLLQNFCRRYQDNKPSPIKWSTPQQERKRKRQVGPTSEPRLGKRLGVFAELASDGAESPRKRLKRRLTLTGLKK